MEAAILDTIEREKNGFREPRIGEWYLTANPNLARDVAAGSLVLKSAYPELAPFGFNPPIGHITPINTSIPFSYNTNLSGMDIIVDPNYTGFMSRYHDGTMYRHYFTSNMGLTNTYLNISSVYLSNLSINPNTKTVICCDNSYTVYYFTSPSYTGASISFSTHGSVYGTQYYNNKFYVITSNGSGSKIFASTTGTSGYATIYDAPGVVNNSNRNARLIVFDGSDMIFPHGTGVAISGDGGATWKRLNFPNPDSVIGGTAGNWFDNFNQNGSYPFVQNGYLYLNFSAYFVAVSLDAIKNTANNGTIPLTSIKFLRITAQSSGYNNYPFVKYDPISPNSFLRSESAYSFNQQLSIVSWDPANSPALTTAIQNIHIGGFTSGAYIGEKKLLYWYNGNSFTLMDYSAMDQTYALPYSVLPTSNFGAASVNNPKPINYYLRYK